MFGLFKRYECRCENSAPKPGANTPVVPAHSPARALADSLTDPETRGEWVRTWKGMSHTQHYSYRNERRDITVTRSWGVMGYSFHNFLRTPFTLSPAEKDIVREALATFDKREREVAERAAYSRLTAQAIEAEGGDAKTGSVRKDESAVGKADAPKRRR